MECIRCSNGKNLTMVKIHLAKLLEFKDMGTSRQSKYSIQQTPTIYYVCDNCIDEYRRSTAKHAIVGTCICILLAIVFIVFHHVFEAKTRTLILIFIALTAIFASFRIRLGRIYLLEKNDHILALPHLEESARINPRNAETQNSLGVAYFRNNRPEDAIKAFINAEKVNPNDKQVLNNIMLMYKQLGNNVMADEYSRKLSLMK